MAIDTAKLFKAIAEEAGLFLDFTTYNTFSAQQILEHLKAWFFD